MIEEAPKAHPKATSLLPVSPGQGFCQVDEKLPKDVATAAKDGAFVWLGEASPGFIARRIPCKGAALSAGWIVQGCSMGLWLELGSHLASPKLWTQHLSVKSILVSGNLQRTVLVRSGAKPQHRFS